MDDSMDDSMDNSIFDLILSSTNENELTQILSSNEKTAELGLSLNEQDAKQLLCCRKESLKKYHRIEFSKSILDQLIYHFGNSDYLDQNNYLTTLERLQDIFYEFKNLTNDQVTDEELLNFMEEQFNGICYGDTEYLETTCLEEFSQYVRNGGQSFHQTEGHNIHRSISDSAYYDKTLYYETLKNLF